MILSLLATSTGNLFRISDDGLLVSGTPTACSPGAYLPKDLKETTVTWHS